MLNSFATRAQLDVNGNTYAYASLPALGQRFDIARLPYSLKILLENLLRHEDGVSVLPADTAADWRKVFGFAADAQPTPKQVDSAFKALARQKHPDAGGTDIEMAHLNRARDYALMEL